MSDEMSEVERLRAAIIKHRSRRADDRCIEDDDELYAVLGDGIKCDRRVGSKEAMLVNCARFIERRCEGGGWPSYAELETRLESQRAAISAARAWGKARAKLIATREKLAKSKSDDGKAFRAFEAWERANKNFERCSTALADALKGGEG
jgi:hypothetical protein